MENLSVYHGPIGKQEGERRLGLDGRDGCYLVRNSDSVPDVYCLCVLCNGFVYTYRLHRDESGSWAAESPPGTPKRYFRQIRNLIAAFQRPEQGIVMPLLYPVTAQRRARTPSNSLTPNARLQEQPHQQHQQHQQHQPHQQHQQHQQQQRSRDDKPHRKTNMELLQKAPG